MADRASPRVPRRAAKRPSLGQPVLTVAAAAATSAALIWSALFYDANNQDAGTDATGHAPAQRGSAPGDTGEPAPAPAPVTTRTS